MFQLLWTLRCLRKAKGLTRTEAAEINEMVKMAAAYGWEIGAGQPIKEVLDASPANPFLYPPSNV